MSGTSTARSSSTAELAFLFRASDPALFLFNFPARLEFLRFELLTIFLSSSIKQEMQRKTHRNFLVARAYKWEACTTEIHKLSPIFGSSEMWSELICLTYLRLFRRLFEQELVFQQHLGKSFPQLS